MDSDSLTTRIKASAGQLGFALTGVCRATEAPAWAQLQEWLEKGYAGQMRYIPDRRDAYRHPRHVLAGVRSIVMLGMPYRTVEPETAGFGQGRISRYAWGPSDYHDVIRGKLRQLRASIHALAPEARVRGVVDTVPLLERDFARLAGLGWIGKNTMLINRRAGSWFFLAALLTDLELAADPLFRSDHCGTCRACLDACPTGAFPRPYVLDARRCISYLTIELRSSIPHDLRPRLGDWLFGCDVCQDVCPWNRKAPAVDCAEFTPRGTDNPTDLIALFWLDEDAFSRRYQRAPLWRAGRAGILRNAAVVLGNQRAPAGVPALIRGLEDAQPVVRGACAWALGRIPHPDAAPALRAQLACESDSEVRHEIERACSEIDNAAQSK